MNTKPFVRVPKEVWERDDLSGSEKLVFISLCSHYNHDKRVAWPSIPTIEKETGLKRQWTITCLSRLESVGLIQKIKTPGKVTMYKIPSMVGKETELQGYSLYPSTQCTTPVQPIDGYPSTQCTTPVYSVDPNKNIEQEYSNKNMEQEYSTACGAEEVGAEPKKPKRKTASKEDKAFEAEFERLYEEYPYSPHNDKTRARKNYCSLRKKGASFDDLKKAVENYAASQKETDPKYIKGAANFFSDRVGVWKNYVEYVPYVHAEVIEKEKPLSFREAAKKAGLL